MTKKLNLSILALAALSIVTVPVCAQTMKTEPWLEVPETERPLSTNIIRTASMSDPVTGKTTRNFTYAYAPAEGLSLWVAYPLNRGLIGQGSRTDAWDYDPDLPKEIQRVIYKSYGMSSNEYEHFDRGHQIPSADRLQAKANRRTFAFTNIAPQDPTFNGGLWNDFEQRVRSWAKRSDTLYVVTGVMLESEKTVADNLGNAVKVPSHFWKAVLRRNTDKRGKVHWSMCAVVLPNTPRRSYGFKDAGPVLMKESCAISTLERYTGLKFFPELEKIVGKEEYRKLKTEDPADEAWWWN